METAMITGCSSGFGLETARYFLGHGWNVIATMRNPRAGILPDNDRVRLLALDVANGDSIAQAVAEAGPIDVLVNNAGIGWLNAIEGTSMEMVRHIFETNTFGTIAMTKAVLPQFRERRSGVVVNVTSATTLIPMHLLSIYTASKAAINAFTESLALELEQFNVRARLVIPGRSPTTSFSETARSAVAGQGGFPPAYADLVQSVFARHAAGPQNEVTYPQDVAEAIWRAATDSAAPVRLPAGADAVALAAR